MTSAHDRSTVQRTESEADAIAKAQPKPDALLGATLAGKYAIEELLGEGAMGRVYRAKQTALDKRIALKVLHHHLTGEERIAKRFHREARAASRLSHPNSMQILDFGATEDGNLYIAMELLDGEDLQTVLDHDFPLTPARIAAILVPVLRALEEAHRAGVIHRDLKPENVVVLADRSGREHVKVCDFGIAKILDGEERTSITVDGFVCGTPQYMAPEQARGDDIDHRSDIYAAGVVLYAMMVGAVPFSGENALGIITRHLMEEPVPPTRRRPDLGIPKVLEAICLKAMDKDPAKRFPSAAAMADALEAAVRSLGTDANTRLGEGAFRGESTEKVAREPAARASDARSLEHASAPRSGRPPLGIAFGIAVAAITIAGTVGIGIAMRTEPTELPETARAPERVAAPEPVRARDANPRTGSPPEVAASPQAAPVPDPVEPRTPSAPVPGRREPRIDRSAASDEPVSIPSALVEAPAPPTEIRSPGQIAFEDGRRSFLANDVPGAIARFEEAARLMPGSADVQKQLGRAYMRAGDRERSVRAYRRYLEMAPDAADRTVVERIIAQH